MPELKNKIKKFPKTPGMYLMKNAVGKIIYVGKATSLRDRVKSYFDRPHDIRIEKLVSKIADIDYQKTPTVIEALILEANLIKKYLPKYNVKEKDDRSFLYVAISKEKFPRIFLLRGLELARMTSGEKKQIAKLFGPYTSASSLRAALDILRRKIFPFRDCVVMAKKPCLHYHLKQCPAPCAGFVSIKDYRRLIHHLILFFEGKKEKIIKNLKKEMAIASREENFEKAARLRNQIFSLEHIQDVAILTKDTNNELTSNLRIRKFAKDSLFVSSGTIDIFGRIEGYDISNISGTSATGSMVVFEDGKPNKNEYRKFKIKTLTTPNDVGMMKEVMTRRLKHLSDWPLPNIILVDGGWGQINAVREILSEKKIKIPVLGVAKGFDRKQDRLIADQNNPELVRVAELHKDILLRVRDEAHRFAIGYHKLLRRKKLFNK
ncbi:excinuclease ABC subunit UvrC [Candidatus Falkowbacteria bacterium]|nr:excinuclease ABC subunit UvrC [Candidatus Falkowbacteria bacterium]